MVKSWDDEMYSGPATMWSIMELLKDCIVDLCERMLCGNPHAFLVGENYKVITLMQNKWLKTRFSLKSIIFYECHMYYVCLHKIKFIRILLDHVGKEYSQCHTERPTK